MAGVVASIASAVAFLVGGFDLSCYFTSVEPKFDVDMKDNTTLCATSAKTYTPGLANRMITGEGFFAFNAVDDTLSIKKLFDDAFSAAAAADRLITLGQKGVTQGYPAIMFNTKQAKHEVKEKVGDLITTSFEANATDDGSVIGFAYGFWLYQATVTGAVNGATYDNTASATGYVCNVHHTDADGTTTVKVQHSVDGTTWVDLINFGALAINSASQAVSTVTTVNRYLRAIVTSKAGTTAKVSVAIKTGYTG